MIVGTVAVAAVDSVDAMPVFVINSNAVIFSRKCNWLLFAITCDVFIIIFRCFFYYRLQMLFDD